MATTTPAVIRTLNWNLWMIPAEIAGKHYGLSQRERAVPIAARINTGDYDVVTLNEVFSGIVVSGPQGPLIYYLTGDASELSEDPADAQKEYQSWQALPGDEPIKPIGRYPYFAWVPGFKMKLEAPLPGPLPPGIPYGDAGLAMVTKFKPLPRDNVTRVAGLHYVDQGGLNFFCFGVGEDKFKSLQSQAQAKWLGTHGPLDLPPTAFTVDPWVWASAGFKTSTPGVAAGAYAYFDHAAGDDAKAIKGVAWFRVQNPKTNEPLNILTTHTQADYPEAGPQYFVADRETQLEVIERFIAEMVPANEDVIMSGDFNILGDGGTFGTSGVVLPQPSLDEYDLQVVGRFGAKLKFADSFRQHLRPPAEDRDPGWTRDAMRNGNDGTDPYCQRLDYTLVRWSNKFWVDHAKCVQHVRVRRDFDLYKPHPQWGADLSDHFPIEVTVGFDHGYPSPAKAFDLSKVPTTTKVQDLVLDFAQPGTMQWLRLPKFTDVLGTADQAVNPADGSKSDVRFQVFACRDISMPLQPPGGNEVQGPGGVENLGPGVVLSFPIDVYVRIQPVVPGFVGSAKVRLTRMDGTSFEKAVFVGITAYPPESWDKGLWAEAWTRALAFAGTNIPGQVGQQELWIRYNVSVLQPSLPHNVAIHVLQGHTRPAPGTPVVSHYHALYDGKKNLVAGYGKLPTPVGAETSLTPFRRAISPSTNAALKYSKSADSWRVVLKRGVPGNAEEQLRINVTTDVRGAKFHHLAVITPNDSLSSEEPAGMLNCDGTQFRMKGWDVAQEMKNWNVVCDPLPAGAHQHNIHFKQQYTLMIGESSMSDDTDWDASAVEWYIDDYNHKYGGVYYAYYADVGLGRHDEAGGWIKMTREDPSQSVLWDYTKAPYVAGTPSCHVVTEFYMPGAGAAKSDQ